MDRKKERKFAFSVTIIFVLIYLGSCASRAAVSDNQLAVYLTNRSPYILLSPDGIEKPMDMAQYISISYGDQDYYFNAWVQADETGMEMTLFNDLGAAMGELSYRDGFVQFSSPLFPSSLKPEYIVADFQLCFYDPLLLSKALKNCGLALETAPSDAGDGTVRRILKGKNTIIRIEKEPDAVKIHNILRGYTYTLKGDFK